MGGDKSDHQVIYLEAVCEKCRETFELSHTGRCWCEDDNGPCEECGKPWVRYVLDEKKD